MNCLEANQAHDFKHYEDPKHLLRLTAFICVLHQLGILLDGKLLKNALDTLLRYQRVSLERNVYWSPQAFIAKHAKTLLKVQDKPQDNLKQYLATVERINGNDFKSCRQLGTQLALWSISMQRVFTAGSFDQLKSFSKLIIQGQGYANQVNDLINGLIKRHLTLNLPVGKATLFTICKLMQYLQMLQKTFADNQTLCMRFMSSLLQWQKQKIQHLLMLTKKSIVDLKLMQKKISILTTLKLSEKSIKGYPNKRQLNMVNLALSEYLDKDRTLPADKQKMLKSISLRTHNLCSLQGNMLGQFDATQLISNYDALTLASEAGLKEYVQQQRNPYKLQVGAAILMSITRLMHICPKLESVCSQQQIGQKSELIPARRWELPDHTEITGLRAGLPLQSSGIPAACRGIVTSIPQSGASVHTDNDRLQELHQSAGNRSERHL